MGHRAWHVWAFCGLAAALWWATADVARAAEVRRDHWAAKYDNGARWDTTSHSSDLDREVILGAKILKYRSGRYVHTLHKQYPKACGPAALAMVLKQLGITDPPRRKPGNPRLALARRRWVVRRDVDIQGSETVDVGYAGSMEHLMWLGYHRKRLGLDQGIWNNGDARFMDTNGVLNTGDSGHARSQLAVGRDMAYLRFTQIPSWMWRGPAVGCGGEDDYYTGLTGIMNYIFSGGRNGPWRDARPLKLHGRNDAEVVAYRRIIKGFIDHNISLVIGVDNRGHFNTIIGYRGAVSPARAPFHIYTADPLNGWGRSDASRQPLTWRRISAVAGNMRAGKGLICTIICWNHHAAGGADVAFRRSGWATTVDRQNGTAWLTGRDRQPHSRDPLSDRLARRAERLP